MISYDTLHKQIHEITELSNVLTYLVQERSMCDTRIACSLLQQYISAIKEHIGMVDRQVYPVILINGKQSHVNSVHNFMDGSQELKRILKQYTRNWCKLRDTTLKIGNHDTFLSDTDRLFTFMLERLQDETEKLYPLARKLE